MAARPEPQRLVEPAPGRPAVAALLPGVADGLREIAAQVDSLDVAELLGRLEVVRVRLWTTATSAAPPPAAAPSRGLDVAAVAERTGMSADWIYREVRAGRLPFARRHGRRVVFDQTGLDRWLKRRAGQRRP